MRCQANATTAAALTPRPPR